MLDDLLNGQVLENNSWNAAFAPNIDPLDKNDNYLKVEYSTEEEEIIKQIASKFFIKK